MTLFDFGLTQSLLLLVSLCLCLATTDLTNQNVTDSNSTESIHQLSRLDGEEIGCTESISLRIKPCFCKDIARKYSKNKASTSDVNMQGVWLYCDNMNLEDDQMSRILTAFLSSEVNRNYTRRIDLDDNLLTKIPSEIYQFKQLQKVWMTNNKIKSIGPRQLNLNTFSTTGLPSAFYGNQTPGTRRLTRFIYLSYNQISEITAGALEGAYSQGSFLDLEGNNLTRFESSVFKSVLEQMVAFGGIPYSYIEIDNNPIDCATDICHLAWLIRDNRHLMKAISGQCSNGTVFKDLMSNDYADCPAVGPSVVVNERNSFCPEPELIGPCKCVNYGLEPNNTMALDCNSLNLNDEEASHILNTFIRNSGDFTLLSQVSFVWNRLTKIPQEIRLFPRLTQMNFGYNQINTIRPVDFSFASPIVGNDEMVGVFLGGNIINFIEPGTFDGEFFNRDLVDISFIGNQIARFDSSVFQNLFERSFYLRNFYFHGNLFDCETDPCHFEWYTVQNPYFSHSIYGLQCSNGNNKLLSIDLEQAFNYFLPSDDTKSIPSDDSCLNNSSLSLNVTEETNTNGHSSNTILLASIVSFILLVILFVSVLAVVWHKYQKNKKEFQKIKIMLKGNPNAALKSLDENSFEFQPYEKQLEFPMNRLRLGQELGSGAFGRVVKAEAIGLKSADGDGESDVKTVAVKMVRSQLLIQNQVAALEALVAELKVMIYLGSHLNVVNLLGACTKRASKGEVLMIVEYCRYGNLHSYVIKAKNRFVNQVDSGGNLIQMEQDKIDKIMAPVDGYFVVGAASTSIGAAEVAQCGSDIHSSNQIISRGKEETEGDDSSSCSSKAASLDAEIRAQLKQRELIEITSKLKPTRGENQEEIELNALDGTQQQRPDWSINYEASNEQVIETDELSPVSTRDLICWSFQIARGMDFLVSKKVLHGDLAARNVLLADDGVVKVADFGLSRQLYQDENYMKQSQGKLPVKWMAPESLTEMVFSSQSDVWSFGVVLWELFSLGKTPYPGMGFKELIRELQGGYRMDKPQFITNEIGQLMAACWKADPNERPTFNKLQEALSEQLETSVTQYYLSMNEPYTRM